MWLTDILTYHSREEVAVHIVNYYFSLYNSYNHNNETDCMMDSFLVQVQSIALCVCACVCPIVTFYKWFWGFVPGDIKVKWNILDYESVMAAYVGGTSY